MGKLFVISAPSGTGKTSLIRAILEDSEVRNTSLGISCTTREPRAQEEDGISYFFVTTERFNEKIKNDEFLEYARALDLRANSKNVVSTFDIKFKNLNILKVFHLQ